MIFTGNLSLLHSLVNFFLDNIIIGLKLLISRSLRYVYIWGGGNKNIVIGQTIGRTDSIGILRTSFIPYTLPAWQIYIFLPVKLFIHFSVFVK